MKGALKLALLSLPLCFPAFGSAKKVYCLPYLCIKDFLSCCHSNKCHPEQTDSYFFWHWKNPYFVPAKEHTEIFRAIETGNLQETKKIFEEKKFELRPGAPFAHAAAFYDKPKIFTYFISKGASPYELGLVKHEDTTMTGYIRKKTLIVEKPYTLFSFVADLQCSKKIKSILAHAAQCRNKKE